MPNKHNGNGKSPARVIDWPGIRAASVTLGIRGAARFAGKDLPPDELTRFEERVLKRATREGWHKEHKAIIASHAAQALPLSANVLNGSELLSHSLADLGKRTRHALAKATVKAAEYAEEAPGVLTYNSAANLKSLVGAASTLHGWEAEQGQGGCLSVDVLTTEGAIRVRTGPSQAQD